MPFSLSFSGTCFGETTRRQRSTLKTLGTSVMILKVSVSAILQLTQVTISKRNIYFVSTYFIQFSFFYSECILAVRNLE